MRCWRLRYPPLAAASHHVGHRPRKRHVSWLRARGLRQRGGGGGGGARMRRRATARPAGGWRTKRGGRCRRAALRPKQRLRLVAKKVKGEERAALGGVASPVPLPGCLRAYVTVRSHAWQRRRHPWSCQHHVAALPTVQIKIFDVKFDKNVHVFVPKALTTRRQKPSPYDAHSTSISLPSSLACARLFSSAWSSVSSRTTTTSSSSSGGTAAAAAAALPPPPPELFSVVK